MQRGKPSYYCKADCWECTGTEVNNLFKTASMSKCSKDDCGKDVKANQNILQCKVCDDYYHNKCAGVADKDYASLKKVPNAHWLCDLCNHGYEKMITKMGKMNGEIKLLKQELDEVKKGVGKNTFNIDKMEQYSRKDSIRLSGIEDPHTKDEDTNDKVIKVAADMGITLTNEDISVSHRLGKVTSEHARPIIVKLVKRDTKKIIMMSKKKLKDNNNYKEVYINEDLTASRYKMLRELRDLHESAWTREGKIIVKEAENKFFTVDSYQDFCKLKWSENRLKELDILQ